MAWIAPVAAGVAALGGGIAGAVAANNASNKAQNRFNTAQQLFQNIQTPDISAEQLHLQNLVNQGQLTPQQEQAYLMQGNAYQNISEDPRLQGAQLSALSKMSGLANANGMDPQAKAQLLEAQTNNNAVAAGQRAANLQNAAQRGVAGSGLEFVGNQMADQGAAQANQLAGAQAASSAADRGLSALSGMAGLSGNIRAQNYGEAANQAQAQNAINQFNTQAQQQVANTNVQNNNAAQQYNLGNQQRIADQNVLQQNAAQQYNKGLYQQDFSNQIAKAQGSAGLAGGAANAAIQSGQTLANLYGGMGQAAAGAGASIYNNQNQVKPKYDPNTGAQNY